MIDIDVDEFNSAVMEEDEFQNGEWDEEVIDIEDCDNNEVRTNVPFAADLKRYVCPTVMIWTTLMNKTK